MKPDDVSKRPTPTLCSASGHFRFPFLKMGGGVNFSRRVPDFNILRHFSFNRFSFSRWFISASVFISLSLIWGMPGHGMQDRPGDVSSVSDASVDEAFRRTLAYLTELATRTRLNADDTPGMVSVLYGRDLEERGVRNVAEAMTFVPGMRMSLTSENVWRMVIRGMPRTFASGHVKVLLDGTPLTSAFGVDPIPNMPIEQVDRIEIVRGPVSVVHGEFADAGVMNIITRKTGAGVHAGIGQYDARIAGGLASAEDRGGDLRISLNVSGQNASGATLHAGSGVADMLQAGMAADSADEATDSDAIISENARAEEPEEASWNRDKTYRSGIASLQLGRLDLQAHRFVNRQPEFYDSRLEGFRARHRIDPADGIRIHWNMGWQTSRFQSGSAFKPVFDFDTPSNDCLYGYNYDEHRFQGGASVIADLHESHTLMLEGNFSETDLEDVTRGEGMDRIRYEGRRRRLTSLTIQDEFRPVDALTLTAGVRYDHYDDIGDYTTPRLAAVWRIAPHAVSGGRHVLKAQIARSHRPPSFMEMLINSEPEVAWNRDRTGRADVLELGYIYRSLVFLGRITLFHSLIEPGPGNDALGYEDGILRSTGGETELEVTLIPEKLTCETHLSLLTLENDSDRVNDWMATASLTARPIRPVALSLLYRFEDPCRSIGNREGEDDVSMDAVHRLDLTVSMTLRKWKGVTVRAGVKNLAKADIRYPSRYNPECHRPEVGEVYTSGEQRLARWWWTGVTFEF